MNSISEFIQNYLGFSPTSQEKLLSTIIVIVAWLIVDKLIKKFIFDKIDDYTVRYQWQKIVKYITVIFAIMLTYQNLVWCI